MSADGRPADATHARDLDLESASFVRLVTRADGDALAASGLLARTLAARGTPFQVTVGRTVAERTERARTTTGDDDDRTLVVGAADLASEETDATRLDADDRSATLAAVDHVRELGETPDLVLALAGLVAAGVEPGAGESEWLVETAVERGLVDRRPGVAVPTADPIDGLGHSTRLRAPWSGDVDAARDALADVLAPDRDDGTALEADAHRTIGSLVALDAVGADGATEAAATSIQRALRPYATPDGPFETVGGYADVLEATARTEPGTGAALAMGHEAREPALSAWREYGRSAHEALEDASTGRYDGLFVVGVDDGPVEAVARIAAAYRSPEPTVLAVGEGEAAIAAREDGALPTLEGVARELEDALRTEREGADDGDEADDHDADRDDDRGSDVEYDVGRRRGYLRYDRDADESTIIAAVRAFQ